MRGKGNGSLGQALLTSVKSMQSLHFPFALRMTTGLANHVEWSTPLTRPAASNFLISSAMNSWRSTLFPDSLLDGPRMRTDGKVVLNHFPGNTGDVRWLPGKHIDIRPQESN